MIKKDITIIAPSKESQDLRCSFTGLQIVNPVQIVTKHEELHFAVCSAIDKVTTEFFHIYDNDDTLPLLPEEFPNVGIIFGDNLVIENGKNRCYKVPLWSFKDHLVSPLFIHRAICRTEDSKKILKEVSHLPILTEWWLYSHLAKDYGYFYNPDIKMFWNKKQTGLHTESYDVIENTRKLFNSRYF